MAIPCTECDKSLQNISAFRTHFANKHPDKPMPEELQPANARVRTTNPVGYKPPPDPAAQNTMREQFAAVAMNLGINEARAVQTAWYITENFAFNDPIKLKEGLAIWTMLTPAEKHSLWLSWTHRTNPNFDRAFADDLLTGEAVKKEEKLPAGDRYISEDGIVKLAAPGQRGVPYSEALLLSTTQQRAINAIQGDPKSPTFQDMMALVQSAGSKDATQQIAAANAMLEMYKEMLKSQPKADDNSKSQTTLVLELINARSTAMSSNFDSTIKLLEERHKNEMALIRESNKQQFEKLNETLDHVASALQGGNSPWTALDKMLPGASQRITDLLFKPQQSDGLRIRLDDGNGNEGSVSIDTYERLENIKNKKATMAWLKQTAPEFLETGRAIAGAVERAIEAQKEEKQQAMVEQLRQEMEQAKENQTQASDRMDGECINCHIPLSLPKTAKAFYCPDCRTFQSIKGERLKEPVAPPTPKPVDSTPANPIFTEPETRSIFPPIGEDDPEDDEVPDKREAVPA